MEGREQKVENEGLFKWIGRRKRGLKKVSVNRTRRTETEKEKKGEGDGRRFKGKEGAMRAWEKGKWRSYEAVQQSASELSEKSQLVSLSLLPSCQITKLLPFSRTT